MDPAFPPELEQYIFDTAGRLYPAMIPTLLLVARRIQIWIEPLLYEVIWPSSQYRPSRARAVLAAMATKPAPFFQNVRHLLLDNPSPFMMEDAQKLIRLCPNIVNLAIVGPYAHPALLSVLSGLRLRHLAICPTLFSANAVDFHHPIFASVTHLDLVDFDASGVDADLRLLPALTHLCVNADFADFAPDVMRALLADCTLLKVLVNLWPASLTDLAQECAKAITFKDARLVIAAYTNYWHDWEAGARGRGDFWDAAEAFVARKRAGEIPESAYWMGVHSSAPQYI
ncbi:hypothetical protein C8R46DRAFT_1208871 [Mycena filopes]|nr:hypothetical protein C8R46DRAFT_1208871 [Mycena filopes]